MLDSFREVVVVDFEFTALPGERPDPVCLVARELRSGRRFRIWLDGLGPGLRLPYATGTDVLLIAFYTSAELGCYRWLGQPMPQRVLDLFIEFRNYTNGLPTPAGSSLLGALTYFGLDAMGATEKKEMQEAIGNGTWRGRFTPEEILDYCEADVDRLIRLLPAMLPRIDLPRALLRGRYMAAAAAMEQRGCCRLHHGRFALNWSKGQSHSALKSLGVLMASMDRKSNLRRDDPSSCLMSDGWSMSALAGFADSGRTSRQVRECQLRTHASQQTTSGVVVP